MDNKAEFYNTLPVLAKADIVVCGGGTAGAFAAIAAAREDTDVLLIEQLGSLGGTAANGLVTPVMKPGTPGEKQCSYIAEELRRRLYKRNACSPDGFHFDPTELKFELEAMAVEAGVRLLYNTFIPDAVCDNGMVSAVIVANKSGLSVVKGKIFIDCTGDGDICAYAGADYRKGNPKTGINQAMSLRYIIDGVDFNAFGTFLDTVKKEYGINSCAYSQKDSVYAHCCKGDTVTLTPVFEKAIVAGDLLEEDHIYWQVFSIPGRRGSLAFNCPEIFVCTDGTNPWDLSAAQIKGKQAIRRQLAFYKKYMNGFENAYIAEAAVMVGVRESREIITDYVMQPADLLGCLKKEDMICQTNYPADIHGEDNADECYERQPCDSCLWYDIPFRSLLVKEIENLMVAGRCMGADFFVQSSIRVQHSVRSSGEAAGIGASLALKNNISVHKIDGQTVRGIMIDKGALYA